MESKSNHHDVSKPPTRGVQNNKLIDMEATIDNAYLQSSFFNLVGQIQPIAYAAARRVKINQMKNTVILFTT